jgi:hypothetical protein
MKKIKSIQLKAAILLIVFSLNTIIGFACSVGLDMGFNSHHHEEEVTEAAVHMHSDGKKHLHHNEARDHHSDKVKAHHEKSDKDNCCNDEVTKIAQQDKAIAPSISIISPVFFTALISTFYNEDALLSNGADSHIRYLVRRHHPPIPDIRLAIQSFQI